VIERGWLAVSAGRIAGVGSLPLPTSEVRGRRIDLGGRVVLPSFVDCHTHACFAGERYDEFAMRVAGRTYLDILAAGGGIMSTVRATRAAGEAALQASLRHRVEQMRRLGTGAIRAVAADSPAPIVPTFLGAHAIDPALTDGVDRIIEETLPLVAAEFPGIACDAYCEQGAWSVAQCERLFVRARSLGLPIRVHLDQFNALGMLPRAIELGARSVDHLEASRREDLDRLAASDVIAVLLPACGFWLDDRYADARRLIDGGGAVAVASNLNPGSAPSPSVAFAASLACRRLRMSVAEAINAVTVNAACVLGLERQCGRLEAGLRADLQVLDSNDERAIGGEFAGPGPAAVSYGGRWTDLTPAGLA